MTILKILGRKLSRFFSYFGEDSLQESAYDDIASVVERARCGDQVAIALITKARKNAAAGDLTATRSLEKIKDYCLKKPVIASSTSMLDLHRACIFGKDVEKAGEALSEVASKDPETAAVTISNTCDAAKLAKALSRLMDGNRAFVAGYLGKVGLEVLPKLDHEGQHAFMMGYVVGMATRIQLVRKPGVPLAVLSKELAWECGQ